MRVGIGLPTMVPGVDGRTVIEWAKRADNGPFSSVAVLDRVRYDSYEPLVSLAAAAAMTERVRLATNIIIAPLRNTALLAKTAMSVHRLSGGRLVLGMSVGARQEDYDATGVTYSTRGRHLNEQLMELRSYFDNSAVSGSGPELPQPEILVGGLSDSAYLRVARYADGYMHGGGPPRAFARAAERVRAAWVDGERPGWPELWGQGYFAFGPDAGTEGIKYLLDYYAFTGAFAARIAEGLLTTPQAVAQFLRGYADAGCDELVLFPALGRLDQLGLLADVLATLGIGGHTVAEDPAVSVQAQRVGRAHEGVVS